MAKTKKSSETSEEQQETSCDLISLLTLPNKGNIYELEINGLTCKNGFELPDISELPSETTLQPSISPKPAIQTTIKKEFPKLAKPIPDFSQNNSIVQNKTVIEPLPLPQQTQTTKSNPVVKATPKFSGKLEIIPGDSLEKIREDIKKCELCGLCKSRKHVVPGEGNSSAKLMFIGEAPGAEEDNTGIPFVGAAGQHLDKILAAAGFKRDEVFICNILKCRPPNNRDPHISEMIACTPFLKRQIQLIKPKIIACLGNIAVKYVIGPTAPGITKIHGQWANSIFGIKTMALYHPSYLIRNDSREKGSPNWQMWQDIKALKKVYDTI